MRNVGSNSSRRETEEFSLIYLHGTYCTIVKKRISRISVALIDAHLFLKVKLLIILPYEVT